MVTITELIEKDRKKTMSSFDDLKAKLQKLKGKISPFEETSLIHSELMSALDNDVKNIAAQKDTQWRIVNYSLLIDAALITSLTFFSSPSLWKVIYTKAIWIVALFVSIIATRMLSKTHGDLEYHRRCAADHKALKNIITGLHKTVEEHIVEKHAYLKDKPDDEKNARENENYFQIWFIPIVWIAFAVTVFLSLVLAGIIK